MKKTKRNKYTGGMVRFRIITLFLLCLFFSRTDGQVPLMKKLSVPELLPTQVVYDMLADSKGYIWFGTNKGLYRFNGKNFVSIPFDKTLTKEIAFLQEDEKGDIWCMNFFNQFFHLQKDTLRRFDLDEGVIRESSTFVNMLVDSKYVWAHSFETIYQFDKETHKLVFKFSNKTFAEQITSSVLLNNVFYAMEPSGKIFKGDEKGKGQQKFNQVFDYFRCLAYNGGILMFGRQGDTFPVIELKNGKIRKLPPIDLPKDKYLFMGTCVAGNEYWLCTQSGGYRWDPETGRTTCFFPDVHVSDIAKDYQGNYWFSTLTNGVFVCPSLDNTLLKIYNQPLQDNFSFLLALSNGEIMTCNYLGLTAKMNVETGKIFKYDIPALPREAQFFFYDSIRDALILDPGVFDFKTGKQLDKLHYGKGIARDKFGNLLVILYNLAVVMNDDFKSSRRNPIVSCPLYRSMLKDTMNYFDRFSVVRIRAKRGVSVLSDRNKDCFWIGYDDGLYEYHYDGRIQILKDRTDEPVVARSLQQQPDGSLAVGSSTRGLMVFKGGKLVKIYNESNGLSSRFVKKILCEDRYIWVLTESGFDRIDAATGAITNYFEEYGLSSTIVNDFVIQKDNIFFATPTGILKRIKQPDYSNLRIRFSLLKAKSNGEEIKDNSSLPDIGRNITFFFEALHYLSPSTMIYQYHLIGQDTSWHTLGGFSNQLSFNGLSPGSYVFEIRATAGVNYKSDLQRFSFTVQRPFWQKLWFYILVLFAVSSLVWIALLQWKNGLLRRQRVKEQLLKSQLVALRAQMNPHFLYNVLNTVQGLVYGNRKTEAGELLGNFSDLMRKTLQASNKQLLSLEDEIDNLRLYLELEKARFDEGFSYHIDTRNIPDVSDIYIPSLLLQPFAENSVKHGLMHKTGNKKVEIVFEKQESGISVTIDDNGIGRTNSMEINQRSKNKPFSFATEALNERMELFNRLYKQKIRYAVIDKVDDRQQSLGTRIELFIPDYQKENLSF